MVSTHRPAKRQIAWMLATTASALLPLATPAQAQVFGEDIVVTAQKREENLQDVAVSVTALNGEQIKALGLDSTVEITQQVPGLQLNTWSPAVTIFNLRGVSQNNFMDNLEAPVAVYTDDVYVPSVNAISGQLFDTERVEVLRGPQGTLFGRNATGGLIHFVSRRADDPNANGYVEASIGNYDTHEIEAAIGLPITDDLRIRVAGKWKESDGYVKSVDTNPFLPGSGQDIGGENGYGVRGTLQWTPDDRFTADLIVRYSRDDEVPTGGYVFSCVSQPNGYCTVNEAGLVSTSGSDVINPITGEPASPFEHFGETPGFFNREAEGYQANLAYEFDGGITLTSITNYNTFEKSYLEDGDAQPLLILNFGNSVDFKQFSQELRLSGETGPVTWQVGGYYLDFQIDGLIWAQGSPFTGVAIEAYGTSVSPTVTQRYILDSLNWSVFGQADFAVSDTVTLTAGVRWSQDDKHIDYASLLDDVGQQTVVRKLSSLAAGDRLGFAVGPTTDVMDDDIADVDAIDYGDFALRAVVQWEPNPDLLLFASYDRGIKGGNWSLNGDLTAERFRHGEEVLDSFQLGIKSSPADGLTINATAFYYDYSDYQAFALTGGTAQIVPSDATVYGGEIETIYSPTPNWDFVLGASFLHSKVERVETQGLQFGPEYFPGAPDSQYCTNLGGFFMCDFPEDAVFDAELPNAPDASINYIVRYNHDILGGNIAAQVDGVYYSDQYLEVTNGRGSYEGAYNVTNASLTFAPGGDNFELKLWAKNVFNEAYRQYSLDGGIQGVSSFFGRPRTYGVTARASF